MKIDRMLAIVMLLLNRNRVSAKELADKFEVSLRTVYRDVEAINQAGIPVVSFSGTSGGYEIADRYRLERQTLSLDEVQSIIIALRGIQASLGDSQIGGLLDKVGAMLAKSERGRGSGVDQQLMIDMNAWHSGKAEKLTLSRLREAIRDSVVISFAYTGSDGEQSARSCEPMAVVLKGYTWYLYGYCLARGDFRIFRLSRMRELQLLPKLFRRRDISLQELDLRWGSLGSHQPLVRFRLRFAARARARVEDYFEPEQIRVEEDGTLLVEAEQPDEPWLTSLLLSYGSDVAVLEPDSLKRALRGKALAVAALYAEAP